MSINVKIRSAAINISISRVGGNGVRTVEDIDFTAGAETVINTGQSNIRPRFIQLYDSSGKRIDKNLPEPQVTLSTNYIVTYTPQLIPYSGVTMYYI